MDNEDQIRRPVSGDLVWMEDFLPDPVVLHTGTTVVYPSFGQMQEQEIHYVGTVRTINDIIVEIPFYKQIIKATPASIAYWKKHKNAPESLRLKFSPTGWQPNFLTATDNTTSAEGLEFKVSTSTSAEGLEFEVSTSTSAEGLEFEVSTTADS